MSFKINITEKKIINGEVMNLNIKNNDKIVGYPIPSQKETTKKTQYADVTNLFVNNSLNNIT